MEAMQTPKFTPQAPMPNVGATIPDAPKIVIDVERWIVPNTGVATNVKDLLQRSRDMLVDEGNWVRGSMLTPAIDDGRTHAELAQDILDNGFCEKGWQACATGAVSLFAGLTGVVNVTRPTDSTREVESVVTEGGSVKYFNSLTGEPITPFDPMFAIPHQRVALYGTAKKALDEASEQLFGRADVVDANDAFNHADVVAVFDQALANLG